MKHESICIQFGVVLGIVIGAFATMFFFNVFIIPSEVEYAEKKVRAQATTIGAGFYELNRFTGEVDFIWKAPTIPAPDPVDTDELYPSERAR